MTDSEPSAATPYEEAEPPASDVSTSPRLSKSKPNGVLPADALTIGAPAIPSSLTAYVSIVLEVFSVTTSVFPFGENATSAGPALPAPSGRVEPARGASSSWWTVKPVMLPLPPALSTYSRWPWSVTLVGRTPPDPIVSCSSSPSWRMRKYEIELSPALT